MTGWRVEEHGTRLRDFVSGLADDRAFDEAAALIKLVGERGNALREPRSKPLGDGLFELARQVREDLLRISTGTASGAARWRDQKTRRYSA